MVYLFGFVGFVIGFGAGLLVIRQFLHGYAKKELLDNKSLRWTYGVAVWIFAGLGAWLGVWLYERSLF